MNTRVLIADDDYDNRTIAQEVLKKAGYQTIVATNGEEALSLALHEKPDLILLDLSMPKISGWDVAKHLRADPHFKQVPIIAFTAHAMNGDAAKAMAVGCDGYLSKPCSPREIVAKVGLLLKTEDPSWKR